MTTIVLLHYSKKLKASSSVVDDMDVGEGVGDEEGEGDPLSSQFKCEFHEMHQ
jgi:hypothetical protein